MQHHWKDDRIDCHWTALTRQGQQIDVSSRLLDRTALLIEQRHRVVDHDESTTTSTSEATTASGTTALHFAGESAHPLALAAEVPCVVTRAATPVERITVSRTW
jgi:hypothetical protein